MQNCLSLLVAATALTTWSATDLSAHPLTLINCAASTQRAQLDGVQPGAEVAGVVMANLAGAQQRAELVLENGVERMIATGDAAAIVRVTRPPERRERGETTCLIFSGETEAEPLPPATWTSKSGPSDGMAAAKERRRLKRKKKSPRT